jgi:hypothetical protein
VVRAFLSFDSIICQYDKIDMDKSTAAWLNTTFWATFALGRIITVPLSLFVPPLYLLLGDFIISIVSSVLMLVFYDNGLISRNPPSIPPAFRDRALGHILVLGPRYCDGGLYCFSHL